MPFKSDKQRRGFYGSRGLTSSRASFIKFGGRRKIINSKGINVVNENRKFKKVVGNRNVVVYLPTGKAHGIATRLSDDKARVRIDFPNKMSRYTTVSRKNMEFF